MIKQRTYLYRLAILGISGSLLGCAAQNHSWQARNDPQGIFRSSVKRIDNFQGVRTEEEPLTENKRLEMTSRNYEMLGDAFFQQGNIQRAYMEYEKSLALAPDNMEIRYKKGLSLLGGGMNEAAIQEFGSLLESDPENALAYEGIGFAYLQMKKHAEAEESFRKAVELESTLWRSHNALGIIYSRRGMHAEAIREYQTAVGVDSNGAYIYNNLGIAYSALGKYEKAIAAFKKALATKTALKKTHNNLGLALARSERYREALEAFREWGDDAQAYNNLGCVYLEQGKIEAAIRSFEKAMEMRPTTYKRASENLKKARMKLGIE